MELSLIVSNIPRMAQSHNIFCLTLVTNTIPTGIFANFSEAKFTSDGNFLYALLMGALYVENQIPSQLVQIDLSTRQVIRNVVFDLGLEADEYVNGFVSQNNGASVLTNTIDSVNGITTISIYSVALTGNTYGLVKLTNFSNAGNSGFLSQLYQLGDYLVTNNLRDLIFLDKQGKTVSTYTLIGSNLPLSRRFLIFLL